jgi:hypothetical protein
MTGKIESLRDRFLVYGQCGGEEAKDFRQAAALLTALIEASDDVVEARARGMEPGLFSHDAIIAGRAASPFKILIARERACDKARAGLKALIEKMG